MKRHIVFAICLFLVFSNLQGAEEPKREEDRCELFLLMLQLFRHAALGKNPDQNERAAWVVGNTHGKLELIVWPDTNRRNKQYWKGPIPSNMIALVHVHNVTVHPRPSFKDKETAGRINADIYSLHVRGIFRVTPDGAVTQVRGPFWFDNMEECSEQQTWSAQP